MSVASPRNDIVEARRRAAGLGALLGASAASLVVLGVLSLLGAEGVEPFAGSAPVLAGLLCGMALVVAGMTGIARRHVHSINDTGVVRLNDKAVIRGEVLNQPSPYHAKRVNELANRRRDERTRTLPAVPSAPPRGARTGS